MRPFHVIALVLVGIFGTPGRVAAQNAPPGSGSQPPAPGTAWRGALNVGLDFSRGNTAASTLAVTSTATRQAPRNRLGLTGTFLHSTNGVDADAVTTARTARGGLRYDHDLRDPLFVFGSGELANDPLQLLDLRVVVGGGSGVHLVKTSVTQLNVWAGGSFARDAYEDQTTITAGTTPTGPGNSGSSNGKGPKRSGTPPSVVRTSLSRTVGEVLLGQDLTRQLSAALALTEAFQVAPSVGDLNDLRASFDLSLSAQLGGFLQWSLSVSDRYLQIPPAGGAVQNDLYVTTGLGVTFGRR